MGLVSPVSIFLALPSSWSQNGSHSSRHHILSHNLMQKQKARRCQKGSTFSLAFLFSSQKPLKTSTSWRVSLTRRTESHAYPIFIPSKGDVRYGCYRNNDSFLGTDCNLLGFWWWKRGGAFLKLPMEPTMRHLCTPGLLKAFICECALLSQEAEVMYSSPN